jgi:hypothetical protein
LLLVCAAAGLSLHARLSANQRVRLSCSEPRGGTRRCIAREPFPRLPARDLLIVEGPGAKPMELRLALLGRDGSEQALPPFYGSTRWPWCELSTVDRSGTGEQLIVGDLNGDTIDDFAVVAECSTGAGPAASKPFMVGAIYYGDQSATFRVRDDMNRRLTSLLGTGCAAGRRCNIGALIESVAKVK